MKKLIFIFVLTGLSACKIVPDEIAINEGTPLVSYEAVDKTEITPSQSGQMARWGGEIVKVENKPEHSEIEIVFYQEKSSGKPKTGTNSPGRFIAVVPGFVDPLVIEEGRLITVVGSIGDTIKGQIGEQAYQYPTVNTEGYYVWQKTTEYEVDNFHLRSGFYGSRFAYNGWIHPWNDPYWGFPYRHRLILKHKDGGSVGGRTGSSNNKRDTGGPLISEPSQDKPDINDLR